MDIISLIVILVVIGVLLYVVNTVIPIDAKIRLIINIVVVLAVCLWLLNIFVGPLHLGRVGRIG